MSVCRTGRVTREGLSGDRGWKPAWREPEPRTAYDRDIAGGGTVRHDAMAWGTRARSTPAAPTSSGAARWIFDLAACLRDGRRRGRPPWAVHPLKNSAVEVTEPGFVEPEGERPRG